MKSSGAQRALYGGLPAGKPDVLVSYSPPLPLGLSAGWLSRVWRVPWVLQLNDIYPGSCRSSRHSDEPQRSPLFSSIERFINRSAAHISVICKTFR